MDTDDVIAWGLDYEGTCPVGSDETWMIGNMDSKKKYDGFVMVSGQFMRFVKQIVLIVVILSDDYEPQPVAKPNGRCRYSEDFVRMCDHQITVLYGLSHEQCFTACSNDFAGQCAKAHNHPPFQIWPDVRTNACWLWRTDAKKCDWNGGESGSGHPGAQMFWCTDHL